MGETRQIGEELISARADLALSREEGTRRIFIRFLLVAVGLNALVASGVVIYDVADSVWVTRGAMRATGDLLASVTLQLRNSMPGPDEEVVASASTLTGAPLGLLDRDGRLVFASDPGLHQAIKTVFKGRPPPQTRFAVRDDLGALSGAWMRRPFNEGHELLLVVHRHPEAEGLFQYMTIAAGLSGLGIGISFLIMLAAANWMLRRPLSKLVSQLTGELASQLAFRDNLLDSTPAVGIVATDAAGKVRIFNRAAERILGYPAASVLGLRTLADLRRTPPAPRPEGAKTLLRPREGESPWVDRAGREVLLALSESEIVDAGGRSSGTLLTFVDVTERRRLEAELQLNELQLIHSAKMATLGEMATGIAHELNQPLNNIGLLASRASLRIARIELESEARSFLLDKLEKLQGQVERASRIIGHLRIFGRVSNQRLSAVSLRESVEAVLDLLQEQLSSHDIGVEVSVPSELPEVLADGARLEQVLMNLLVNARDALESLPGGEREKKIQIAARSEPLASGQPGVSLEVRDNGPGMASEVASRVFEPFFTTKDVGKGTGLGLSISYGLVREFGGTLEVDSVCGEGSTFRVRLAVVPSGRDPRARRGAKAI